MAERTRMVKVREEVARYLSPGTTYDPLRQPLYDHAIFAAAVAILGEQSFFQTGVGGAGIGITTKTELDTNFRLQATLPAGHVFEVYSPRIIVRPVQPSAIANPTAGNPIVDVDNFVYGCFLRFKIVSQEKLVAPAVYVPAGMGVQASAAFGTTVAAQQMQSQYAVNGMPSQAAAANLSPFPVVIPPLQQFTVSLTFPAGVTPTTALHVWIFLDGNLYRPALP